MKNLIFVIAFSVGLWMALPAEAGVSKIEKYGKSATGEQIYKITCTNGGTYRYFWRKGECYRAGIGAAGMSSYSLQELAEKRCG